MFGPSPAPVSGGARRRTRAVPCSPVRARSGSGEPLSGAELCGSRSLPRNRDRGGRGARARANAARMEGEKARPGRVGPVPRARASTGPPIDDRTDGPPSRLRPRHARRRRHCALPRHGCRVIRSRRTRSSRRAHENGSPKLLRPERSRSSRLRSRDPPGAAEFWINPRKTDWSSLDPAIADRDSGGLRRQRGQLRHARPADRHIRRPVLHEDRHRRRRHPLPRALTPRRLRSTCQSRRTDSST